MVWYCLQLPGVGSARRLYEMSLFGTVKNHGGGDTETQKTFLNALLRAAVGPRIGMMPAVPGAGGKSKEMKGADPAFDTIDLIVRALVKQESALSRMMRALSDAPSVGVEDITEDMALSRTFVAAPEVILAHFVCRMLEEAEQLGRYGVEMKEESSGGGGGKLKTLGWMLDSDGTATLVQKAVLLLKLAQARRRGFAKDAEVEVSLGMPSRKAVVAWAMIEGEALEVMLSSLCSALVQVKQRELAVKAFEEEPKEEKVAAAGEVASGVEAVQAIKSVLCDGTLLRAVLQELAQMERASAATGKAAAKSSKNRPAKIPVRSGLKTLLMQCVANLCSGSRRMQDMVREVGGILVVLNCCSSDIAHPMLREWGMVAVRHLCDGNMENQNVIARLEKVGEGGGGDDGDGNISASAARLAALKAAGIEASVDGAGKMTLRRAK